VKISVRGPIISSNDQWIYDWFGIEATSPKKINDALESIVDSDEVTVEINSGGGSVFDASEIYALLKAHPNNVTVKILGLAASAASVIAMAGDKVLMAPTAQLMIHNSAMRAQGDYRDMNKAADFLKTVNETIASAYNLKSGKSYDELLALMDEETWLKPKQALDLHLIDEIMFENSSTSIVASVAADGGMLPQEVIDTIRNQMGSGRQPEIPSNMVLNATKSTQNTEIQEEPKVMNLETLKNDHPELFNQVKNIGFEEGITAENNRIKEIEELQMPGNEALINKAKFEEKIEASALAVQIIKAEKERGTNYLNNVQKDAQIINDIPGGDAPASNNGTATDTNALLSVLNGTKDEQENELTNQLGGALQS